MRPPALYRCRTARSLIQILDAGNAGFAKGLRGNVVLLHGDFRKCALLVRESAIKVATRGISFNKALQDMLAATSRSRFVRCERLNATPNVILHLRMLLAQRLIPVQEMLRVGGNVDFVGLSYAAKLSKFD